MQNNKKNIYKLETIENCSLFFSELSKQSQEKALFLFLDKVKLLINNDSTNLNKFIYVAKSKNIINKLIVDNRPNLNSIEEFIKLFSNLDESKQIIIYPFIKDQLFRNQLFSEEDFNSFINVFDSKELIRNFIIDYGFKLDSTQDILDLFSYCHESNKKKLYQLFDNSLNIEELIKLLNSSDITDRSIYDKFGEINIDRINLLFLVLNQEEQEKAYNLFKNQFLKLAQDEENIAKILNFLPPKAFNKFISEKKEILISIISIYEKNNSRDISKFLSKLDEEKFSNLFCHLKEIGLEKYLRNIVDVKEYLILDCDDNCKLKFFKKLEESFPPINKFINQSNSSFFKGNKPSFLRKLCKVNHEFNRFLNENYTTISVDHRENNTAKIK